MSIFRAAPVLFRTLILLLTVALLPWGAYSGAAQARFLASTATVAGDMAAEPQPQIVQSTKSKCRKGVLAAPCLPDPAVLDRAPVPPHVPQAALGADAPVMLPTGRVPDPAIPPPQPA